MSSRVKDRDLQVEHDPYIRNDSSGCEGGEAVHVVFLIQIANSLSVKSLN